MDMYITRVLRTALHILVLIKLTYHWKAKTRRTDPLLPIRRCFQTILRAELVSITFRTNAYNGYDSCNTVVINVEK